MYNIQGGSLHKYTLGSLIGESAPTLESHILPVFHDLYCRLCQAFLECLDLWYCFQKHIISGLQVQKVLNCLDLHTDKFLSIHSSACTGPVIKILSRGHMDCEGRGRRLGYRSSSLLKDENSFVNLFQKRSQACRKTSLLHPILVADFATLLFAPGLISIYPQNALNASSTAGRCSSWLIPVRRLWSMFTIL